MISVTVPVFNEVDSILPLHARVSAVLAGIGRPWELIFVNDGSTDGSDAVLDELADDGSQREGRPLPPQLRPDRRDDGRHRLRAAATSSSRWTATCRTIPPTSRKLLAKLDEGYDVVSRLAQGPAGQRPHSATSRAASPTGSSRASRGVRLHDFGCSLKAYRREVIKDVRLYGEMHRFIPIYASLARRARHRGRRCTTTRARSGQVEVRPRARRSRCCSTSSW